jgi:hypothetical protein
MEQTHYHCHLCRRENPENHQYYNRYEQLERHFEEKHFPCPHERCKEDKFVVFTTAGELKRHIAQAHGDEMKMDKHERRAAMRVETGFAYDAPRVRSMRCTAHTSAVLQLGQTLGRPCALRFSCRHDVQAGYQDWKRDQTTLQGHQAGRGHGHAYGNDDVPATQQIARPLTVVGGGGAGAVDMRARAIAESQRALDEAQARMAQQSRGPVDLQAEEQFPGLQGPGPSASGRGPALWGRGVAPRGVHSSGDFPSLGGGGADVAPALSKGQRKKLKSKARRDGERQYRMGDESGMPPSHVMALGPEAALRGRRDGSERSDGDASTPSSSPSAKSVEARARCARSQGTQSLGDLRQAGEDWAGPTAPGVAGARPQLRDARGVEAVASSFAALSAAGEDAGHARSAHRQGNKGAADNSEAAFPALGGAAGPPGLGAGGFASARAAASARPRASPAKTRGAAANGEDFPSLGGGASVQGSAGPGAGWSTVPTKKGGNGGTQPVAAAAKPVLSLQTDFPTLGGPVGGAAPARPASTPGRAQKQGQVSKGLQEANEAVTSAIKVRCDPDFL